MSRENIRSPRTSNEMFLLSEEVRLITIGYSNESSSESELSENIKSVITLRFSVLVDGWNFFTEFRIILSLGRRMCSIFDKIECHTVV